MNKILKDNLDEIVTLCKNHKVKSLYAFGSVCTETFNDNSDIDLLVSFSSMDYGDYTDNYFHVADKFESIFQRPVDLITDKSLANPYFIESLNKTKMLLYEY